MGGGVCIGVRTDISFQTFNLAPLHDLCSPLNIDICGLRFFCNAQPFHLFSLYNPPANSLSADDWGQILDHVASLPNTILTGDFNCRHSA